MQLTTTVRSHIGGFTLIELMISVAIGLIAVSAVLGLIFANLQNTTTVSRGVRLTQESRALTEVLTKELRRAGFDGSGMNKIGSGTTATTFTAITILAGPSCPNGGANCCIKYGYDVNRDGDVDAGEFRSFSRDVVDGRGVVRFGQFATAGAVDCTSGAIITSDDISVGDFRFRRPATTAAGAITSASDDACFIPKPAAVVTLPSIPVDDIYFAMNLSLPLDRLSTSSRRTDGVISLR